MLDANTLTAALRLELDLAPVPDEQVVAGSPCTGFCELEGFGGLDLGVWEMTAGAMSDTEADEVFIVIAGGAEVRFIETDETLTVGVGDVVRLRAGQQTVWTVQERIRKVYLA